MMQNEENLLNLKSKAVRDFFPSLKKAPSDSTEFKKALQITNRAYKKHEAMMTAGEI